MLSYNVPSIHLTAIRPRGPRLPADENADIGHTATDQSETCE